MLKILAGLALAAAACATTTAKPAVIAATPSADVWKNLTGVWIGEAATSPLGPTRYALVFHPEGDAIVAETPPPPGGTLPKGAYQKFVIKKGSFSFQASLGEGTAEGTLAEQTDEPARLVYCATDGGCAKMRVVLAAGDGQHLSFQTWIRDKLHADISLTRYK